jgi:cytochrome d ubiquinol oxidase subunit II
VRTIGVIIVSLVLFGWYSVQYPVAIRFAAQPALTFVSAAAPPPALRALLVALMAGVLIIFPALIYLFRIFKWQTLKQSENE